MRKSRNEIPTGKVERGERKRTKTYDFFRPINFYSPTPQVSRTKVNEIINMMKASGDLPADFDMNKIFLSGVTQVVD